MNSAVTLTFSLKYLVNFSKSSSLSKKVQLMMSNDVPLLVRPLLRSAFTHCERMLTACYVFPQVSYAFNQGHIRYYLAPKIGDD